MTRCFHLPVDAPGLLRSAAALAAGAALSSLLCAAQTANTPPIVIPYTISTVAGSGAGGSTGNGGPATQAQISSDLRAVAVDGQGNVYFTDTSNKVIRKVNAQTGIITLVAGGNSPCTAAIDKSGDGCPAATGTTLNNPRGVAVDKAGNVYIAGYSDELVHEVNAQTGIMTLVAGDLTGLSGTCTKAYSCAAGTKGYSGDGGPATSAALNQPRGVSVDNYGNIWISDTGNNVVREVNAKTGIITTVVGNVSNGSASGFSGDGSQANSTSVELATPTDVVFDSQNNAYVVDFGNKVIREVNAATNVIETVIGQNGGTPPVSPSWPAAATTPLGCPAKAAIDSYGNLYFTDSCEGVIDFYDASAGTITPIAGEYGYTGTPGGSFTVCAQATDTVGDGCPATQALFYQGSSALGVALDGLNNIYITDPADFRIRKVSTNLSFAAKAAGQSTTQTVELHFAKGDSPAATNGIAIGTSLGDFTLASTPSCTVNSDSTVNCTAQVAFSPLYPGLRAAPLVVNGTLSHRSFPLSGVGQASLTSVDPGTVSTLGSGLSGSLGEAMDANGNLYIADTANNRVVEINSSSQAQTVVAGTGAAGYTGDGGLATQATLSAPRAVAIGPAGYLYIADTGNNVVRVVDPVSGNISTFAGGAATVCATAIDTEGDFCPAKEATLAAPGGVAVDTMGDVYIADTGNNLIRRVDAGTGYINLDAGGASSVCASASDAVGDGCPAAQATLNAPRGLALDAANDLFVADSSNNLVREVNPGTGNITVVAGNGQATFAGDGSAATSASLNAPQAIALDAAGDLYIADTGNAAIRVVNSASSNITTLFGQGGMAGSAGGSGAASQLQLSSPGGITVDSLGNVYVSDSGNNRALADNRNTADLAFGSTNVNQATPEQTAIVSDLGNATLSFTGSPVYAATGDIAQFTFDTSAATACQGASNLATGATCTLGIIFDPAAKGSYTAALTLPGNAINAATATIDLSGSGVYLAPTTLTLALTSPAGGTLQYGESGTITATVAPTSGSGTPTGSIVFTIDGTQQPAVSLSNSGTATLTINLAVGSHTIGAEYTGDSNFAASNNSLPISVTAASTTTTLSATPSTTIQLQNIVFTATVSAGTSGTPTGTVDFYSGTTLLGSANLNPQGVATFNDSSLAVGSYSVTATYVGNNNYSTSTSSQVAVTVNPIPPDFSAGASSTTLSVPQGGNVQTILTVTPQGGISGTITLSCTGLPANSKCTFYPTTIPLSGANTQVTTALTIYTNVTPLTLQSQVQAQRPASAPRELLAAALFPALLFGFAGCTGFRRRHWNRLLALLVAVGTLSALICIQGCTSNATQQAAGVTPTGTSTVNVVLSGPDNITQTIPITLTVVATTN